MKLSFYPVTLGLITLLGWLIFYPQPVSAQKGIGVFPPVIKARVVPGASVRQPIRLFNDTQEEMLVKVNLRPFELGSLDGLPLWSETVNPPEWIRITAPIDKNRNAHVVKPGGWLDFILTINPPAKTAYQDRYLTVIFQTKTSGGLDKVRLSYQIGVNVLISVTGSLEVKVKPVQISRLHLPVMVDSWSKRIPVDISLYNPNPVWVEAVPFVRLIKWVGIGPDESLNL